MDEKNIPGSFVRALKTLKSGIPPDIKWAVDGSLSLALQGYEVTPEDIDIITDAEGAYLIERTFKDKVVEKVKFGRTEKYESHFGIIEIEGVRIDLMGNLRVFRGKEWTSVQNPAATEITMIMINDIEIPVVSAKHQEQTGYLEERLRRA